MIKSATTNAINAASLNIKDNKIVQITKSIGLAARLAAIPKPLSIICKSPDIIETNFPEEAFAFDFWLNLSIFLYSKPEIPFLTAPPTADE